MSDILKLVLEIIKECGKIVTVICSARGDILSCFGRICGGTEEDQGVPDAASSSSGVPNAASSIDVVPEAASSRKAKWIGATDLEIIVNADGERWVRTYHNRERKVVEAVDVGWILIKAHVNAEGLENDTMYAAYLVFDLRDNPKNLERADASVTFGSQRKRTYVYLDKAEESRARGKIGPFPERREDGWMEINLGEVLINNLSPDDVEITLSEDIDFNRKSGLLLYGIEIRPSDMFN